MNDDESQQGFLSRWSRRKAQARRAEADPALAVAPPAQPGEAGAGSADAPAANVEAQDANVVAQPAEPPPTLADVAALTPQSDFTRFVARDVTPDVKNAALKKLFADPHFNAMDGLDVYIDDYTRPEPLAAGVLARLAQAQVIDAATRAIAAAQPPAVAAANDSENTAPDEDADLQLQPHDAARCAGAEPDAGGHSGRGDGRTG